MASKLASHGLSCGIVGLPNVGKSTLFNVLTNGQVAASNFPFCTIDPNVGIAYVPDQRLQILATLVKPNKVIPTSIKLVDIAGLVKGASQGEGLGTQFLAYIREVDAILHIVRCFHNDQVAHVAGQVDPRFDKAVIDHELQLKDLETIGKRIMKIQKMAKSGREASHQELAVLNLIEHGLTQGINVRDLALEPAQTQLAKCWQLLTLKPIIYVANVDEHAIKKGSNTYLVQLKQAIKNEHAEVILVCASLEAQMAGLTADEKIFLLTEYGLATSGLDKLIQASYKRLNLITYFTAGPREVRAWTVKQGTKAPQAAGIIHSDFERGFIKAEVIKLADYQCYQTELACKEAGKVRLEGREYMLVDGDIINFRFNVSDN